MKIAIPASIKDINQPLDSRFGRTPFFAIYDDEMNKLKNQQRNVIGNKIF